MSVLLSSVVIIFETNLQKLVERAYGGRHINDVRGSRQGQGYPCFGMYSTVQCLVIPLLLVCSTHSSIITTESCRTAVWLFDGLSTLCAALQYCTSLFTLFCLGLFGVWRRPVVPRHGWVLSRARSGCWQCCGGGIAFYCDERCWGVASCTVLLRHWKRQVIYYCAVLYCTLL